jgi:hypothetical protein
LYRGPTSESFKKAKSLTAKPQDFRAWRQLGRRNLKGPVRCFCVRVNDRLKPKQSCRVSKSSSAPTHPTSKQRQPCRTKRPARALAAFQRWNLHKAVQLVL